MPQPNSSQDPISKITRAKWAGVIVVAVECCFISTKALIKVPQIKVPKNILGGLKWTFLVLKDANQCDISHPMPQPPIKTYTQKIGRCRDFSCHPVSRVAQLPHSPPFLNVRGHLPLVNLC
jgi:hypothetical protein